MMKHSLVGLALVLIMLPTFVLADNLPDQICVGNPLTENKKFSYSETIHGQVFTPTLNHISKVAIFGNAIGAQTAKVKLKIQQASWDGPSYEKTVVLNNEPWWVEANFGEIPVTPGTQYLLMAQPLTTGISWYYTEDSNCNPAGYAFIGGNANRDKDETIQLENPVVDDETPAPVSSASREPVRAASSSNSSSSQVLDNNTSTPTPNSSGNQTPKLIVSEKEITSANKVTKSSGSYSDEEIDEILKMIAEDYEKNHKIGMFGLSGVVGSILNPTVFYGLLVLVLLGLMTLILLKRKASKHQG